MDYIEPDVYSFGDQLNGKKLSLDDLKMMKGRPLYDEYKEGDIVLFLIVQKETKIKDELFDLSIDLEVKPLVKRTLNRFNKEYNFIRMAGKFPVYERKNDTKMEKGFIIMECSY